MASGLHDLLFCEFKEDGTGPHFFNCWNLCREIYHRGGRQLPIQNDYIKDLFKRDAVIKEIRKSMFTKIDKPEPLAIVTLKLRPRCITHMGCMINHKQFMHISRTSGVSITRLDDRKWKEKIEGLYRYHG